MKFTRIALLAVLLMFSAVFASNALVASDAGPPNQTAMTNTDITPDSVLLSNNEAQQTAMFDASLSLEVALLSNKDPAARTIAPAVGATPLTASNSLPCLADERDGYRDPAYKPSKTRSNHDPTGYRGFGSDHNARAEI